ncbi:MAG TPA: helicase-related protein, partial [Deltaproteobacteria bacterium]|nr:helicase-related protein [Deltaproteobacteria bacterium]
SELTEDHNRNTLIVNDVIREARTAGGVCLVLSDRKNHVEALAGMLKRAGVPAEILHGGMSTKARKEVVAALKEGNARVLCATGQLIGEGFDCPALSTLFITTPIKFDGRLLQYLGRILRPDHEKDRARVYDYEDCCVGVLANAARARRRVYAKAA